jgi:hypothetical protein
LKKTSKQQLRTLNKPHYKHWQALYAALFSGSLYIDVATRWRGLGMRYLLCLFMLACAPLASKLMFHTYQYINNSVLYPVAQLPTLQIDNGIMITDQHLPYFIKDQSNEVVAMVTRFGTMESLLMYYPKLSLLITMDKLYFKTPEFSALIKKKSPPKKPEIHEKDFKYVAHDLFSGKEWVNSAKVKFFTWTMVLSIYPIVVLFFFGLFSSFVLFLSLLGQITAKILIKYNITYKQACRLISVSMTLPTYILFITIAAVQDHIYSKLSPIMLIIVAIYFHLAILILRKTTQKVARNYSK